MFENLSHGRIFLLVECRNHRSLEAWITGDTRNSSGNCDSKSAGKLEGEGEGEGGVSKSDSRKFNVAHFACNILHA